MTYLANKSKIPIC